MNEQRKEKRSTAIIFTPVYDKDTGALLGYLGNLTLQGALLVSEKPIEPDRQLTLAIEFREESVEPVGRITIPARVLWCKLEEHQTYYAAGFEFTKVTEENKHAIETALQRYQFTRKLPS